MSAKNPLQAAVERTYADDDELIAAASKVEATMTSEGWAILWDFIGAAHDDALTRLFRSHRPNGGTLPDQAEYARLCGYLAGILEPQTAAQAFADAVKQRRDALTRSPE